MAAGSADYFGPSRHGRNNQGDYKIKMANIILSVIVVKYKSEEYLDPCLKSLGESPLWEIIVVDNDKNNIGYGGGCNLGAKKAKGKYLLFLNGFMQFAYLIGCSNRIQFMLISYLRI